MAYPRNARSLAAVLLLLGAGACSGAPATSAALGEELFETCAPCHGSNGGGNIDIGAPTIAGLPSWYVVTQLEKFQNGVRGKHPDDLAGLRMRPMAVSLQFGAPGQNEAVAEHIAGMTRVDPGRAVLANAGAGAGRYQVCAVCHGADAQGNADLHAPPLAVTNDWYLLEQLRKFKSGIRGADPLDTWGATMRPNTLALDETAMQDVVAYIQTLR